MELSIRRVNALVKKEMKDFTKNMNVSIICLLPLVYAFLFTNLGDMAAMMPKIDMLNMALGMNFTLVATFAVSMLIAEEKEKNTMRTLMLSSVSPLEFLLGKAIVMSLFSVVTNVAIYFVIGMDTQYLGQFILWSTLVVITMVQIGGIIGLVSPNQMATGVVGMPVLMVFLVIPMLAPLNNTLEKISAVLPNYNFQVIFRDIISGKGYGDLTYNIIAILVWIGLAAIAFAYTYNKKGLDK